MIHSLAVGLVIEIVIPGDHCLLWPMEQRAKVDVKSPRFFIWKAIQYIGLFVLEERGRAELSVWLKEKRTKKIVVLLS